MRAVLIYNYKLPSQKNVFTNSKTKKDHVDFGNRPGGNLNVAVWIAVAPSRKKLL